jgi:hypothetical protein
MEEFKNPNGTYNGVKMMAKISGLSEDEILWTWIRARELHTSGVGKEQIVDILKSEAKNKPWEKGALRPKK